MNQSSAQPPVAGPMPAFTRFWRTVFAPLPAEPQIARLEPSRFGPTPPLRPA